LIEIVEISVQLLQTILE